MKCPACGSNIELVSAQTRSADEARTFELTCTKCLLDASKLLTDNVQPHIYMKKTKRIKYTIPVIEDIPYKDMYVLHVRIQKAQNWSPVNEATAMCCNVIAQNGSVFRYYTSGPYGRMCIKEMSSRQVAPLVSVVNYRCASPTVYTKDLYVGFHYSAMGKYMYVRDVSQHYIVASLQTNTAEEICRVVEDIYIMGFEPTTLHDFMKSSVLGSLSNLTSRGYDRSGNLPNGYLYTTKPNGERIWLTRIGIVWIATRRLTDHSRVFWYIDDTIRDDQWTTTGPCIDLELMHLHPPIFIDLLMDHNGTISPQQRNIQHTLDSFRQIRQVFDYLSIVYIRKYYDTANEAELYRSVCGYPTDGLVAIHKSGMDMLKLKSIKSIELMLIEDGILQTEDGTELMQIPLPCPYSIRSIIEVNFEIIDGSMYIHGHFLRPDKRTANKIDAVRMVMESAMPPRESDILRNKLWRWSNLVRTNLYKRAHRICQDKQIIIDVGTGTGQSIESFIPGKSYILIEPDRRKCEMLAKRLNIPYNSIQTDPRSIIPRLSRLNKGSGKFHILNTTLQSFLSDKVIIANIRGWIGCCVSSLSAQFIIDVVGILRDQCNIPFIGSCYMYDNIGIGESIIDSHGISMTRTSSDCATVSWGKDEPYIEPAKELDDLPPNMLVMDVVDDIAYPSEEPNDAGKKAAEHMKILIYT